MDQDRVLMADVVLELADRLKERLALDVADRTADLNDRDLCLIRRIIAVETALDFICNVRNDLHCASAVIAAPLFLKNGPVNLSGGDIRIFIQALVDKTLIVAKIQVGLSTVIGHEYFAVLDWVHRAWVNIDVRVKFLHGYLVAACLEQTS